MTLKDIERVLSHEYHHVYSNPLLYPQGRSRATWQARCHGIGAWADRSPPSSSSIV